MLDAGCLGGEVQRLTPQGGAAPGSPRDSSGASTATWRRPRGLFDAMERAAGLAASPQLFKFYFEPWVAFDIAQIVKNLPAMQET